MSNLNSVVELHDLLVEQSDFLNIEVLTGFSDRHSKIAIINHRSLNTREQIDDDIFEEWNVIFEELRNIDFSECSEHKLMFVVIRELAFKDTTSVDDRAHCSHTIVVVILRGELFRG